MPRGWRFRLLGRTLTLQPRGAPTPVGSVAMPEARYIKPGWFTRHVFNPAVNGLTKLGISVWGSRELRVRGRTSGEWRSTPVNLLTLDGTQYLIAPRGIARGIQEHFAQAHAHEIILDLWKHVATQ